MRTRKGTEGKRKKGHNCYRRGNTLPRYTAVTSASKRTLREAVECFGRFIPSYASILYGVRGLI